MSTSYYLRNRSDFEEFADYSRFLSGLEKELNQKIHEYAEIRNGKYVNSDLPRNTEGIVFSMFRKLEYELGFEDKKIGTKTRNGFSFDFGGFEEIKRMYNPDINVIVDEYGEEISFEEFVRIVKT